MDETNNCIHVWEEVTFQQVNCTNLTHNNFIRAVLHLQKSSPELTTPIRSETKKILYSLSMYILSRLLNVKTTFIKSCNDTIKTTTVGVLRVLFLFI